MAASFNTACVPRITCPVLTYYEQATRGAEPWLHGAGRTAGHCALPTEKTTCLLMHKITPFARTPIICAMSTNIFITFSSFLRLTQVFGARICVDFLWSPIISKGHNSTFSLKTIKTCGMSIGNNTLKIVVYAF